MLSDWNLVLELEAVDRTVDIVFAWCTSFFTRNYMDFIQALIFSHVTVRLFFKADARHRQALRFVLCFLVSFNTASIVSALIYQVAYPYVKLKGNKLEFYFTTRASMSPCNPR